MFLALALTLSAAQPKVALAPPPRVIGEYVEIPQGVGSLHGIIDLPSTPAPWPVVIIHAGSGPTDRDGNGRSIQTNCLKMLGRQLAEKGIAALRIDKRGIGESLFALTREDEIRLDTYADDVLAWAKLLRKDRRFTQVGFIGHSEGSLIGLVAAKEAKFDAFVSLCGMGRTYPELLREQLKKGLPEELYEKSEEIIAELEAGRIVKETPKELALLFRKSVQPYLISAFKHSPTKLIAEMKCPVLVVGGTTDIQIPEQDAKKLGEANPKAKVVIITDMNHILKEIHTLNRTVNALSYVDPKLPLHPELMPTVGGFLKSGLVGE